MWMVQLALRRPYTFVVVALALLLLGVVNISRMPTDVFPVIDILLCTPTIVIRPLVQAGIHGANCR
jgi:multidrug efflux pump subunit AcrB